MKISSIPKSEPLYDILKSRIINTSQIKDKDQKKYWNDLKKANKIPDIYLSINEIQEEIKEMVKKGDIKNAR